MNGLKRTALGLIAAVQDPRLHPQRVSDWIHSVMDWLVEQHRRLSRLPSSTRSLQAGLAEAVDAYYRCYEHLLAYLDDRDPDRLQEALALVFQAEDLLAEVERGVNAHKQGTSKLWAA